jgi:hypothetical protein
MDLEFDIWFILFIYFVLVSGEYPGAMLYLYWALPYGLPPFAPAKALIIAELLGMLSAKFSIGSSPSPS